MYESETAPPLEVGMVNNRLQVNGQNLNADTSPEVVLRALTAGREEILAGLETYREEMQRQHPGAEVLVSPFKVIDLGNMKDGNLSKSGRILARKEQIIRTPLVLKPDLIPLWETVENSGYIPSVRSFRQYSGYWIDLWAEFPPEE